MIGIKRRWMKGTKWNVEDVICLLSSIECFWEVEDDVAVGEGIFDSSESFKSPLALSGTLQLVAEEADEGSKIPDEFEEKENWWDDTFEDPFDNDETKDENLGWIRGREFFLFDGIISQQ